jgi:hypothetical protein
LFCTDYQGEKFLRYGDFFDFGCFLGLFDGEFLWGWGEFGREM